MCCLFTLSQSCQQSDQLEKAGLPAPGEPTTSPLKLFSSKSMMLLPTTPLLTRIHFPNLKRIKGLLDTYRGVPCGPMKTKSRLNPKVRSGKLEMVSHFDFKRISDQPSRFGFNLQIEIYWKPRETVFINAALCCKFNLQVHGGFDPGDAWDCFASPRPPCNRRELINEERPPLHVKL